MVTTNWKQRFYLRALQSLLFPVVLRAVWLQSKINQQMNKGVGITTDILSDKTHLVPILMRDGNVEYTLCQAPIYGRVDPSVAGVEVDCSWCRFWMKYLTFDIPAGSSSVES